MKVDKEKHKALRETYYNTVNSARVRQLAATEHINDLEHLIHHQISKYAYAMGTLERQEMYAEVVTRWLHRGWETWDAKYSIINWFCMWAHTSIVEAGVGKGYRGPVRIPTQRVRDGVRAASSPVKPVELGVGCESELESHLAAARLRDGLERMSEDRPQDVRILLSRVSGVQIKDICEQEGLTRAAVRHRVHRAWARLCQDLRVKAPVPDFVNEPK